MITDAPKQKTFYALKHKAVFDPPGSPEQLQSADQISLRMGNLRLRLYEQARPWKQQKKGNIYK